MAEPCHGDTPPGRRGNNRALSESCGDSLGCQLLEQPKAHGQRSQGAPFTVELSTALSTEKVDKLGASIACRSELPTSSPEPRRHVRRAIKQAAANRRSRDHRPAPAGTFGMPGNDVVKPDDSEHPVLGRHAPAKLHPPTESASPAAGRPATFARSALVVPSPLARCRRGTHAGARPRPCPGLGAGVAQTPALHSRACEGRG